MTWVKRNNIAAAIGLTGFSDESPMIELGMVEDTTMRVSIMLMNFRKWLPSKRFHGRQQRKGVFTCP